MVDQDRIETNFYSLFFYFWGQHCCWTVAGKVGNDFFVFHKYPLPSTFLLPPPCPTDVPASLRGCHAGTTPAVSIESISLRRLLVAQAPLWRSAGPPLARGPIGSNRLRAGPVGMFLQEALLKLYIRNQIGIIIEVMWTSQKSVCVSVLLMWHKMLICAVPKTRDFSKLLKLLFATPRPHLRDPPVGKHCTRDCVHYANVVNMPQPKLSMCKKFVFFVFVSEQAKGVQFAMHWWWW